jgi:DNA-directed RNA polymerase specialized sigma24 family protein
MDKRQMRAFEGFAAESGAGLLRIATLLAPDPHTAEDVYRETLQRLAALRRCSGCSPRCRMSRSIRRHTTCWAGEP